MSASDDKVVTPAFIAPLCPKAHSMMQRSMTLNSIVGFANESCGSMACPSAFQLKRTKTVSQLTALVRSEGCSGSNQSGDSGQLQDEHQSSGGLSESENGSDHEHSLSDDEDELESCSSQKTVPMAIPAVSCVSLRAQHEAVKKLIYAQQVHEMKRAAQEYRQTYCGAATIKGQRRASRASCTEAEHGYL
eukprot:gene19299-25947_t